MSEAEEDLNALIEKTSGHIYSAQIRTVVGGNAIKKGKKVPGLNDPNARIDVQNPLKKGTYNVQYQIGDNSAACVIFTDEDKESDIFDKLCESLKKNKKAISPSAQ